MTDSGRCTSDQCGWVAYMKRRAGSWIISAEQLAERVGITRESVTNQLITNCHLSSELFSTDAGARITLCPDASAPRHRRFNNDLSSDGGMERCSELARFTAPRPPRSQRWLGPSL